MTIIHLHPETQTVEEGRQLLLALHRRCLSLLRQDGIRQYPRTSARGR